MLLGQLISNQSDYTRGQERDILRVLLECRADSSSNVSYSYLILLTVEIFVLAVFNSYINFFFLCRYADKLMIF